MVATVGARVVVDERPPGCSLCGGPVRVQKTFEHTVATDEHGTFRANETVYVCKGGCRPHNRLHAIHRSDALASRVPPKKKAGYDVMVRVGLARFVHYRQREEIRASLAADGISLSTGTISDLGRTFLMYLERLHLARAPVLRAAMEADGGYPAHVDATGEQGRGTLLVVLAGWRRWVLGAWKIPTERADAILPRLRWVAKVFGAPCAVVRDLGRAVIEAVDDFVDELGLVIAVLACHLHFLRDIGGDLLKQSHDQLRELVRSRKIRTGLAALARDLGRGLGSDLEAGREGLRVWQEHVEQGHRLPDGAAGVACVRALAQWVLDFAAEASDDGFPFDRPYLDLYVRGSQMRRAIDAFHRHPHSSRVVTRALRRLGHILDPLQRDERFAQAARTLTTRAELFEKLREALRLTPKPSGRRQATAVSPPVEEAVAELQDVRKAVRKLRAWLRKNRPARGPAEDRREAIDIILRHLKDHGRSLWGHAIRLPAAAGGGIRLVDRTNNVEEGWFHGMKHDERRRSGRKILTQDLEQLPAGAAYARNLRCPDYVALTCGSLENLPKVFADLDRKDVKEPEALKNGGTKIPAVPDITDLVSASLPAADRKLIRTPALEAKILAAARSRAPGIEMGAARAAQP